MPVTDTVSPSPRARTFSHTTCSTDSVEMEGKEVQGEKGNVIGLEQLWNIEKHDNWWLLLMIASEESHAAKSIWRSTALHCAPFSVCVYFISFYFNVLTSALLHCTTLHPTLFLSSPLLSTTLHHTTHLFISEWRPSMTQALLLELFECSSPRGNEKCLACYHINKVEKIVNTLKKWKIGSRKWNIE